MLDSKKVYKIVLHYTMSKTLDHLKRNLYYTFHLTYAIYNHYIAHIAAHSNYKPHASEVDMHNTTDGKHMLQAVDE